MSGTWVLVAESSRAKLFKAVNRTDLTELEALTHSEGRLHEGDLVSDRAGSDGGSIGQGRHVFDDKVSAKEHEAGVFAKAIANRLETARNNGDFNKLVLVAPPAFLGQLRNNLSKEVMSMVSKQIDKNLVTKPAETIGQYL